MQKPQIVVANKIDIPEARANAESAGTETAERISGRCMLISAVTGEGVKPLVQRIGALLDEMAELEEENMTQQEHKKQILRRRAPRGGEDRQPDSFLRHRYRGGEAARVGARNSPALHDQKKEIVVVSSGAVAAGMTRLGWKQRPKTIPEKQALAAVGQIKLMALYERYFSKFKKSVAQVLLTHEDLANRQRYINAKHTFQMLLESSIIPIVNENDTVAVEEMKFGDNDHLSALAATFLAADLLVILSDVEGVYDRDPRVHADARVIPLIQDMKEVKDSDHG